jgi:hypothetical protein
VSYEEFSTAFQAMYFDTEKKSQAKAALRSLKQTKSVAHYTHTFNIHAHNAGWEPHTLVSQYTQGLKKDVRLALVLARMDFDTLAAVLQLALKIDNKINGAKATVPNPPAAPKDPDAMDTSAFKGRMSDSERNQMMKAGLCFQCEAHNHLSCNCLQKGKGKDLTRISKLKAELRQLKAGGAGEAGKGEEPKMGPLRLEGCAQPERRSVVYYYWSLCNARFIT